MELPGGNYLEVCFEDRYTDINIKVMVTGLLYGNLKKYKYIYMYS